MSSFCLPNLFYFRIGQTKHEFNHFSGLLEYNWHPLIHTCFPHQKDSLLHASLFLQKTCHYSVWSLIFLFDTFHLILFFLPRSCSYPSWLSLQNLAIWTDGSVHFLFSKGSSSILGSSSICGAEANLFYSAGQSIQVTLLKPVSFSTLPTYLSRTCKYVISLCRATFYLSPSWLVSHTFQHIWQKLFSYFSCTIRLQWITGR